MLVLQPEEVLLKQKTIARIAIVMAVVFLVIVICYPLIFNPDAQGPMETMPGPPETVIPPASEAPGL